MKIDTYKAADGWRWRMKAKNGRIIAEGGEAYAKRSGLRRALLTLWKHMGTTAMHIEFERATKELGK